MAWQASHVRVAIIGNFDGVHGGHRALVERARERAGSGTARQGRLGRPAGPGRVVAVTFDPHPAAVLRPDRAPTALTTVARRAELLREAGVDDVVVLDFTPELAASSPEDFARMLRERPDIAADAVIVGDNFRFGARAAGDTTLLSALGGDLGFTVEVLPLVAGQVPGDPDGAWSSTRIRQSIESGDMAAAALMLGRPHRLEGVVVRGDQRGRELGYPTANVEVARGMAIPPDGVYAGWLIAPAGRVGGGPAEGTERLPAAVSIGTNPQFDGTERRVEAYAIGRNDLDLYGAVVAVDLVERLRGQRVFDSVDALVEQMGRDVAAAQQALAG